MKFYEKTDIHMVYVTTQDAVMMALRELSSGKTWRSTSHRTIDFFSDVDAETVNNEINSQTTDNQV